MAKPLLLYDGRCRFCAAGSARLMALSRPGAVERVDRHDDAAVARHPHAPRNTDPGAIQLVMPDGRVFSGAEAVARTLGTRPIWKALVWVYWLPVVKQLCDAAYRLVARNRYRLMGKRGTACDSGACEVERPATS